MFRNSYPVGCIVVATPRPWNFRYWVIKFPQNIGSWPWIDMVEHLRIVYLVHSPPLWREFYKPFSGLFRLIGCWSVHLSLCRPKPLLPDEVYSCTKLQMHTSWMFFVLLKTVLGRCEGFALILAFKVMCTTLVRHIKVWTVVHLIWQD